MPHSAPMPKSGVSPFPRDAAQTAELQEARHELAGQAAANLKAAADSRRSDSGLILGIAVGAAAVATAVLYFNRPR